MKYIYLNLIALVGFIATYIAFTFGYFSNLNNFVVNLPRADYLVGPFFLITDVGGLIIITLASLFLIFLLIVREKYISAFYSLIALLGGLISQTIIKNTLLVSRPENGLVSSFGYSFPSGHANMTTILLLCFCFYVFKFISNRKTKIIYFVISIILIILVGLSRVFLNVHWVSDVLAGWSLGLFWATLPLSIHHIRKGFSTR